MSILPTLTDEEFIAVAETFFSRLSQAMSCAGCNDVNEDEFPKSVCSKFRYEGDHGVLDAWKKMFQQKCAGQK